MTCADDPGAAKLAAAAEPDRAAGALRRISYGESAGADYRVAAVTPAGMATEFDLTPAGRSASAGTGTVRLRIAVPAGTTR